MRKCGAVVVTKTKENSVSSGNSGHPVVSCRPVVGRPAASGRPVPGRFAGTG